MPTTNFIKLTQPQQARLARLLHMEYSLRELADEIGCGVRQLRRAIEAGCPHRETGGGRMWITGDEFRDWYELLRTHRKQPLRDGDAYCLRCRQPVPLVSHPRTLSNGQPVVTGRCPKCGAIINRFCKREAA